MSDILQTELRGRVLRVTLNRPEKRNALNAELCRELVDAVNKANKDPQVGAIVLAGSGKAFSAGMDLAEVNELRPEALSNVHEQMFTMVSRITTPIVAAVDGAALGGGLGLVANCHVVVASSRAQFGLTEIRLGLWPFLVYRAVEEALGQRRALWLALTGRIFNAEEGKALSLVHEIHEDPFAKAMEIAGELGGLSPSAVRSGMGYVQEARGKDWEIAGLIARRVREELMSGPDFAEGVRAFREKRKPVWPSLGEVNRYPGENTL
jgi:enoyl-CoA hydratase/carnithine racemase